MPDRPAPALLTPEALAQIESFELRARAVVEGFITGLHKSPYHGFSVEFAEHRAYNHGDDLRHVDWKVYGRSDRLVLKRYEEETNLRHYVVLDTSRSMRYAGHAGLTKLEYGATLAGALHVLFARQRDATGLVTFDRGVRDLVPPKSTSGHVRRLLARLARLLEDPAPPAGGAETAGAEALHQVADRIPRRSLVVLISDLFDNAGGDSAANIGGNRADGAASGAGRGGSGDFVRALRHLRHRGHEVVVFHVLDAATERRFAFPDAPVQVRDLETGETLTLRPGQVRESYQASAEAFVERLRRQCREAGVEYEVLDTARPYADALRAYLDKRRRLY
ncbi:DUF58 domain-containing protein [Rubrivirga sp. S365]|uniref:DUF58 domain-containing protein n=1 Tax=Rubrivirga litoralis TaxID=3075598 RepID=A0ABU3BM72_9BACT|nr:MULTISPECIES: DUF58 domain-containing protein [unclassified Rubrivirga]MDT0630386.1 DUF58 domain-containing protein [Rubrivirga sp. F394]MDT7855897.1 DUF58 domain-containing protein [Rubrivirga sp. S365]